MQTILIFVHLHYSNLLRQKLYVLVVSLFFDNETIQKNKCTVDMWKTGHSHIKKRVREINALCGFEKSGHFFINRPLGLGFDDGLKSACLVLEYLAKNKNNKLSQLYLNLKKSYQSPTMAPFCEDKEKYE